MISCVKDGLIESILKHAEFFLSQMGYFYPFGHTVSSDLKILPIQAWIGNEFPDSNDMIDFLEKSFKTKFEKNEIILSAICIDIFIRTENNGIETKQDALEIRLSSDGCNEVIRYEYLKDSENHKIDFIKLSDI